MMSKFVNRRQFFKTLAVLPAIPLVSDAPPPQEDQQDTLIGKYVVRAPRVMSHRERVELIRGITKWKDSAEHKVILIPDDVEILRA